MPTYHFIVICRCTSHQIFALTTYRWWKDLRSQVDLSFARDRLVEMYFWMTGIVFETFYSYSRIMLTKLILYMALLDDIYDNYGTSEESTIFTAALERSLV